MKSPSCGALIATGLVLAALFGINDLAVGRWGAAAFWPILIAALVVSWGLLRLSRFTAYREDLSGSLPILYGLLVSGMGWPLGLALWQGLLIAGVGGVVAFLLVDRVCPIPESPREKVG